MGDFICYSLGVRGTGVVVFSGFYQGPVEESEGEVSLILEERLLSGGGLKVDVVIRSWDPFRPSTYLGRSQEV